MPRLGILLTLAILINWNGFSQEAINDYKYIIVPTQYDFQKREDQYQINSLTKFLFNKHGYEAYLSTDIYPEDLGKNNCLALKAVVKNISGMLGKKIQIDLVDCQNRVIATSQEGKSKQKKHEKAYNEAIRIAFITYEYFDYKYNGKAEERAKTSSSTQAKSEPAEEEVIQEDAEYLEDEEMEIPVVMETAKEIPAVEKTYTELKPSNGELLYAQPTDNGYQLVDTTPKVVMVLVATASENTFIVKDQNAIVFKEDGRWYYSKNDGKKLKTILDIKF